MARYNDISEHFYRNNLLEPDIIRVFKFAFPILKVNAKIKTRVANMEYHIVEKYIDKLITGKQPEMVKTLQSKSAVDDSKDKSSSITRDIMQSIFDVAIDAGVLPGKKENDIPLCKVSYMSDKNEVFALLGIDHEVYDLANYFYYDLLKCGHFEETPNGLYGTGEGVASLKMNKKTVSSQIDARILVTPMDAKICSSEIEKYRAKTADQIVKEYDRRIILCPIPEYCYNAELLQNMINEANFYLSGNDTESYAELNLQKKLPAGTVGIEISDDPNKPFCEAMYLFYYLVVRQEDEKFIYQLITTNNVISEDFDLNSDDYEYFRKYMNSLINSDRDVLNCRLGNICLLPIKDKNGLTNDGIQILPNGNYSAALTSDIFTKIISAPIDSDVFPLEMIVNDIPFIIDDFEAGKLVHIKATDEQKDILQRILDNPEGKEAICEEILLKSANDGDVAAQLELGRYYLRNDRNDEAFKLYKMAADQGDKCGQFFLAGCYYYGKGTEKNAVKAHEYMSASADQGFDYAFYDLGVFYYQDEENKDIELAASFITEAAKRGVFPAQYLLGYFYHKGIGIEKNINEAISWYQKASKNGHLVADFYLGAMYFDGKDIEADYEKAIYFFKKVAAQKNEDALEYLGIRDAFLKRYCFANEARKNNVDVCKKLISAAMYFLGVIYERGLGTEKNIDEAINWYKLSDEKGYDKAKASLERLETNKNA